MTLHSPNLNVPPALLSTVAFIDLQGLSITGRLAINTASRDAFLVTVTVKLNLNHNLLARSVFLVRSLPICWLCMLMFQMQVDTQITNSLKVI